MKSENRSFDEGVRYALLAYVSWGFLPIFWKLLKDIPAFEVLCHRLFWACIFYSLLRFYRDKKFLPFSALTLRHTIYLFLSTVLISGNWFLYIWAVNSGKIVESSLGYFINPLVNILLGTVFLKERLKGYHKLAIAIVSVGVLLITLEAHRIPWIALALAVSFSLYGYVRKLLPIDSLAGGQLETLLLLPFTIIFFYFSRENLAAHSSYQWGLLIASGIVTGLPLFWFAEAVRRLPYYLMGFFQFIAPTLMFLCGVGIYGERMTSLKLLGFTFIWAGMLYLLSKSLGRASKSKTDTNNSQKIN